MSLEIVPAGKNVEAQYVDMMVPFYSRGCERKVKKALANLRGIYTRVSVGNMRQVRGSATGKKRVFGITQDNCIIQLKESHSAPQSRRPTFALPKTRYLAIMNKVELEIGDCKGYTALNWKDPTHFEKLEETEGDVKYGII